MVAHIANSEPEYDQITKSGIEQCQIMSALLADSRDFATDIA